MLAKPYLDESDLWDSLQNGSEEALTELMKRYSKALAYYGRKMVRDDSLIQDCIQETFIQLWQYRTGLRKVTEIRPYLFTCLRRKIIYSIKNRPNFETTDGDTDSLFYIDFSIEETLIENENEAIRVRTLNRLINNLPKRQKEAVYLKFYENLGNNEIALVMGIRYQTATNLIHEALSSLREWLPSQSLTFINILLSFWAAKIFH